MVDRPREACGLFGVYGWQPAAPFVFTGLFALQHRGQEGAGIVVSDGEQVRFFKGLGLVDEVFANRPWDALPGHIAIGHVRYSTTGSTRLQNVQPLVVECGDGIWAVAHNGNLVNAGKLRRMYQEAGAIFQTSTDSEVLVHLLADPMYRRRPGRVARALAELAGAFSFLIMTRSCLMAARDRFGFRPLSIGRRGDAWVFASETCALKQVEAMHVRDIQPGELVVVDEQGLHSTTFADSGERLAQCVFELVYFARPDSTVFGRNVHLVRMQYGQTLAKEHPVDADLVSPVPDSGNSAALGYSRGSGLPLDYAFIRNHYVGRTFIMPEKDARAVGVDLKLAVLPDVVKGKRVVIVDDSIVRGTTSRRRIATLREAGAREVHVRVACPPLMYPCFYGIDFPTREDLIAGTNSVEEIRKFIGADTLAYLSLEGLLAPLDRPCNFCTACFTGRYPEAVEGVQSKFELESYAPELPFGSRAGSLGRQ